MKITMMETNQLSDNELKENFNKFLNMNNVEQIEELFNIKLKFYQKLYIKWWINMKNLILI